MSAEELTLAIAATADKIKVLKTDKPPTLKDDLAPLIAELLALKVSYKSTTGEDFGPKVEEKKKKEVKVEKVESEDKGPSKKELNKLARKNKAPTPTSTTTAKFNVVFCKSAPAEVTRCVELFLGEGTKDSVKYFLNKTELHLPLLTLAQEGEGAGGGESISGDVNMARFLVRSAGMGALLGGDAFAQSQVDQWLDLVSSHSTLLLNTAVAHLFQRTYLVGDALTLADIAVYTALGGMAGGPALARWGSLVASRMPVSEPMVIQTYVEAGAGKGKGGDKGEKVEKGVGEKGEKGAGEADGGSCPPLEGAVEGQVCTRFPPEPSGYLHIGHAKAVLLNQYYAKHYKGRLLVRFDDTNPSKEKEEYQTNILADLKTLNVIPDQVSFSSDHFATCEKLAKQLLAAGDAYMDDTDQETMQGERMERKDSKHRGMVPAEGLRLFDLLLAGSADARTYCLRAKIDMQSVNGTMRDPVIYRFNETPHHRTGSKHKAYPTYDLACPIIDSVEGVTHALRTTEYNDRDEQYAWIQQALGLRKVRVHAFGKMNFIHTVLSKRKLNWFVEQKLVDGWFDPRFPTIQGCVRRGMNVAALKNFIISQGASRRVITMEWDKFWAENKKVLEERAPRYMGVGADYVELTLTNVTDEIVAVGVQVHPQKPEMGQRVMRRYNRLLVDQADAASYTVGEEVTFLRWGNVRITQMEMGDGKVASMRGVFEADSVNFSKTKKATWVAHVPDLVPCRLIDFDHLISKAKLDNDDNFQDFVNPVTMTESTALCDPLLRTVAEGDVIQLERKGFYRCDKAYGGADKPAVLFYIPDGKVVKKK